MYSLDVFVAVDFHSVSERIRIKSVCWAATDFARTFWSFRFKRVVHTYTYVLPTRDVEIFIFPRAAYTGQDCISWNHKENTDDCVFIIRFDKIAPLARSTKTINRAKKNKTKDKWSVLFSVMVYVRFGGVRYTTILAAVCTDRNVIINVLCHYWLS